MTVAEAIAFFGSGDERFKSYPVIDLAGRLLGLVSRGDVLRWTRNGANGEDLLEDRSKEVAAAWPDETAGALADRMSAGRYSRVPVIARDSGKLVGIVTRRELLRVRAMALHAEEHRHGAVRLPG
jgi:CBS domain-containing protein